jgi:hypothetical protein
VRRDLAGQRGARFEDAVAFEHPLVSAVFVLAGVLWLRHSQPLLPSFQPTPELERLCIKICAAAEIGKEKAGSGYRLKAPFA